MILSGEKTAEQIREEGASQKAEADVIRYYFDEIKHADAVLIMNYDRRGIEHYVGGNALLEMAFGHVLNKKLFLLNPIPDIPYYKDEIEAMKPVVLNGDLTQI